MSFHLFSSDSRKARKQHRCIWCGQAIIPGDTYVDERSVYDGSIQRHRWHPECIQDARDGRANGDDCEFLAWSNERPPRAPEKIPTTTQG